MTSVRAPGEELESGREARRRRRGRRGGRRRGRGRENGDLEEDRPSFEAGPQDESSEGSGAYVGPLAEPAPVPAGDPHAEELAALTEASQREADIEEPVAAQRSG